MPSIRENIIADLVTQLGTISIDNGYENDILGGVQRFSQTGSVLQNPPVIGVVMDKEEKQSTLNALSVNKLTIIIDVYAVDTDAIVGNTSTLVDSLVTDIEKCVMADPQRSAKAIDSEIVMVQPFGLAESQPYVGASLVYSVNYRHALDDPRSA